VTAPDDALAAIDVAAIGDLMGADEARSLLAAMTPGTLEVAEIRDGRLIDAAPQELAVVIHDDARAHQKPDGTWHSVVVCRGMDGPTRDANAAAFVAVKRALATVAALAAQPLPALDVAAIEAPDARDNLRRVRAMYDAAPPEGCDDGDRTPALERVVASLAGGYSTSDLDARDVRCLMVAFDDAEQIIDALQGQAALLRGEVNELRAKVADLTGDYEAGCDQTRRLGDELRALAVQHAADVAAAVAAERERARALCRDEMALWASAFDAGSDTAIAHYETAVDLAGAIGAGTLPIAAIAAPTGGE